MMVTRPRKPKKSTLIVGPSRTGNSSNWKIKGRATFGSYMKQQGVKDSISARLRYKEDLTGSEKLPAGVIKKYGIKKI